MAGNVLLTTTEILDRAMAVLFQTPTFLDKINRQYESKFFGSGISKYGDTGYVRIPQRAVIRDGRVMQIQSQVDITVPVSINKYKGVDTGATSLEMALDISDYQEQFIDTKIPDLVAAVEADVLSTVTPLVYQEAGDSGLFNDVSTILAAGGLLDNALAPADQPRYMLNNITARQQIVNSLTGFFNPQTTIGDQFKTGLMSRNTLGFDWYSTTLMPTLTRGSANTAYVTNSVTAQTGATLLVDSGSGTFKAGDIITIAGVNAVHPQTKVDLGYLQQFVVTADVASVAASLPISPPIVATGSQQNVTNAAADDQVIVVLSTASTAFQQSLAFCKDAFYFVTADLPMPKGMGVDVAQKTWKGVTMRFMNGFDITQDMFVSRFDIAYGAGVLRPELAVRIPNSVS